VLLAGLRHARLPGDGFGCCFGANSGCFVGKTKGNEVGEGSGDKSYEERLRELGLFSLEEAEGRPHCSLKLLERRLE